MNAKGINIGGKNVKRLTLDGVEIFPLSALPAEYERLEYITILCDEEHGYRNYIKTSVKPNMVDEIEMRISKAETIIHGQMILCEELTDSWLALYANNNVSGSLKSVSNLNVTQNGDECHIVFNISSNLSGFLTTGRWGDQYYSYTHREYGFRYLKDGVALCDAVPCRRKADGVCGMYDLVSGAFMTNAGRGGNAAIVAPDQRLTSNI